MCQLRHQFRSEKVHRCNQLRRRRVIERLMITQPIANNAIGVLGLNQFQPLSRGGILFNSNPRVTVILIELINQERMSHRPNQPTVLNAHKRSRVRKHATLKRTIRPIPHRLCIKARHVKVSHKGLTGCGNIPAVSQSLPVWTIRLNTKNIRLKSANTHLLNLIQHRIGTLKLTDRFNIRIQPLRPN